MAKLVDSLKCTHNYRARSVQNTSAGSALFRCGDCREPVIIRPSSGCRAHSLETRRLRVVFWQRELLKQAQKGALVEILEHLGSALVAAWQLAKPSFHTAHRHLGDHLLLGSHSISLPSADLPDIAEWHLVVLRLGTLSSMYFR